MRSSSHVLRWYGGLACDANRAWWAVGNGSRGAEMWHARGTPVVRRAVPVPEAAELPSLPPTSAVSVDSIRMVKAVLPHNGEGSLFVLRYGHLGNPPFFWHTKLVPENVWSELLRRI